MFSSLVASAVGRSMVGRRFDSHYFPFSNKLSFCTVYSHVDPMHSGVLGLFFTNLVLIQGFFFTKKCDAQDISSGPGAPTPPRHRLRLQTEVAPYLYGQTSLSTNFTYFSCVVYLF